ncbi:MAG: glycosyltransferase [Butyrivibrio sp.]|nr:glycosyltransferase [Butyrivibrio sp.]
MNKIKVLHVGEIVRGGVATYISTLLNDRDNRIENYLMLSDYKSLKNWGIDRSHISYYSYRRNILGVMKAFLSVKQYINLIKPDIIYCHSTWAGIIVRLPLFFSKKTYRVIYNAHGWSFLRNVSTLKKYIYSTVERLLAIKTDMIINVSKNEYITSLLYKIPIDKSCLIYSGIDSNYLSDKLEDNKVMSNNEINLLYVGRFDTPKGVDCLLNQFSNIKRNDMHLYLIGDFVVDKELFKKVNSDKITFLGWKKACDIAPYYKNADVIIVPSRWEAFGLVAVEAMMYAKPVIVSNKGALPELINDGFNGYVFNMDINDSLTKLLNSLDKNSLRQMGVNAFNEYKLKYTADKMKTNTKDMYFRVYNGNYSNGSFAICLIKKIMKRKL